jgi:hypothetical protein
MDPDTMLVERGLLTSHSGKGINILPAGEASGEAQLYTRLIDFKVEQRLFFAGITLVDRVQKKRMGKAKLTGIGLEQADPIIKTHGNGWVYAHNDIADLSHDMEEYALLALISCGLDFGVVDVAWNDSEFKVIEVNTTPGLESPTSLERFSEGLKSLINYKYGI